MFGTDSIVCPQMRHHQGCVDKSSLNGFRDCSSKHTCYDIQPDYIPVAVEDNGRAQGTGRVDGSACELRACIIITYIMAHASMCPGARTLEDTFEASIGKHQCAPLLYIVLGLVPFRSYIGTQTVM